MANRGIAPSRVIPTPAWSNQETEAVTPSLSPESASLERIVGPTKEQNLTAPTPLNAWLTFAHYNAPMLEIALSLTHKVSALCAATMIIFPTAATAVAAPAPRN